MWAGGEKLGLSTKGYWILLRENKNLLKLECDDWLYNLMNILKMLNYTFRWVNYMVFELYFKAGLKNKMAEIMLNTSIVM